MKEFKVKCINGSGGTFTVGKTYLVKDGTVSSDADCNFGVGDFNCLDDINKYEPFKEHGIKFEIVEESKMFTNKDIRSADRVYTNSGCGIAIAFGDDLIVDYTDHSGWDDARSVTINKVVRPTIPYHMTKDGNCEGKVVYDRKSGIGCEPEFKFKKGDLVNVVDSDYTYSTYSAYIEISAPDYKANFIRGGCPHEEEKYIVITVHKHLDSGKNLYVIQDSQTMQAFIIGEDGLERAQ